MVKYIHSLEYQVNQTVLFVKFDVQEVGKINHDAS